MKTAVEWLAEQVNTAKWKFADITDREAIIEQAKEMEKQQIIDSVEIGFYDGVDSSRGFTASNKSPQDYYNKTFKSE
jgi:hypothetical protein